MNYEVRFRVVNADSILTTRGAWLSRYSDGLQAGRLMLEIEVRDLFTTPQRADRMWDPPSLLSNGYWGLFTQGSSGQGNQLTTHLHLVSSSRMMELYLCSPIRLHGVVLN
jgi:hypothetical protein